MGLSSKVDIENSLKAFQKNLVELTNPEFVTEDKAIPKSLMQGAKGIAFIQVYKAGLFMLAGNVGGGVVIIKIPDADAPNGYRWSAPLSVQVAGVGGGFVFGAEKISSIVLLNTQSAIDGFIGKKQVQLGGNASLAVGPLGRNANANIAVSDNKKFVPSYSYSVAKGAYIGGTLDGAILKVSDENNRKFYSRDVTAEDLFNGSITPPLACTGLFNSLNDYLGSDEVSNKELAEKGKSLLNESFSSGEAALPDGWEELKTPEGKSYYFNKATNTTQWERPAPPAATVPPVAPPPPPPVPPAAPSLPAGWTELKTDDGKVYYFHQASNKTQWEKP